MPTIPRFAPPWPWLLLLAACTLIGCGKNQDPAESAPRATDAQGRTAKQYLQAVFSRYRHATSYRDRGLVRLSYRVDGRQQSDQAPLRVWLDGSTLYMEAYDVRVWVNDKITTAWMIDSSTQDFDSQVLQVPSSPQRPDLSALLSDSILNDRLAAGLAGPPPQLDWLLADEPMQRLFADDYLIEFGEDRELDEHACAIVHVNADGDRYRFWIDRQSSLIRRVDLPPILAPRGDADQMRLTLELTAATFDAPGQSSPAVADLPGAPKYVGRFVPLPPAQPPQRLGEKPSVFRLRDQSQDLYISNRGSDREATVLFFVADQEASLWNAVSFSQWWATLTPEIQSRIRAFVVADDATRKQLVDIASLVALDADRAAQRAICNTGPPFDLAILDRDGRIVWLQSVINADSLVPLGAIVSDVLKGIDVPSRMRDQWRSDVQRYRALLGAEMARHRSGA